MAGCACACAREREKVRRQRNVRRALFLWKLPNYEPEHGATNQWEIRTNQRVPTKAPDSSTRARRRQWSVLQVMNDDGALKDLTLLKELGNPRCMQGGSVPAAVYLLLFTQTVVTELSKNTNSSFGPLYRMFSTERLVFPTCPLIDPIFHRDLACSQSSCVRSPWFRQFLSAP